ncbi:Ig-like domain-containing protein [Vitiosangium sp. GDMCC 1.1324]|uniref:Ig-like domain-containing protein n=1 Tax=Vitiosangium sp. (strain GDMCC 1.1324) TaxID=2138576 RepID=UPI000D39ABEF|nr:Ig-like domain-containing protein [Vitiosangium sp. GDMCC 1.1324]PTL85375.1 hypothetical protein DAT35_01255 [Vitiosangium sp. GDMCC 1.1324]
MRFIKAALCLSALMVLGGCPGEEPDKTPKLSEVTVTCAPASVVVGQTAQCTASATDQNGQPFTVSSYSWTSSNESVAKVDATGKATTLTTGTTAISASATASGVTQQGQATLTVTEPKLTVHTTAITANETWRAADNPHLVRGAIEVGGTSAPTLTIEAGVEIRFDQDAELRVTNGALKAMGTQQAPINMVSNQSAPTKGYWRGVVFAAAGSASAMDSVTLSDCGAGSGKGACIALESKAAPALRNVTVRNSGTAGVAVADDGSAFGTGSTMLSAAGNQSYAIRIGANEAGTLPTGGTFTDNARNAVELQGNVSRSQTWPNLGIPYVVNSNINVDGAANPVLTLSAGTVLRFGHDFGLYVGVLNEKGALMVDGTAAAPVLLTADSDSPQPGHWRGVHLLVRLGDTASRISHATLEYAGASSGPDIETGTGNLNVHGDYGRGDAPPVISNLVAQKGSGPGIWLGFGGALGAGSTGLTTRDNGSYALSVDANSASSLPTGSTFSGNAINAVELLCCSVGKSQTWPNLGVPYVINESLSVGGFGTSVTLTLPAGTELRFGPDTELQIGNDGAPGALIAEGTSSAPIRFVPNTTTPTKGYWRGLHLWQASGSKLDHTVVTHAGAPGSVGRGNLNVYREIGAFVTNSTFSDSSGCGITRSDGSGTGTTAVTTDFTLATYDNTFINNDAGAVCKN